MSLQDLFYLVSIITLSLFSIFLIILTFVLLFLKKKIAATHTLIENNIVNVREAIIRPGKIISKIGEAMAGKILTKAVNFLKPKKGKRET